jgi:hypothetical protein
VSMSLAISNPIVVPSTSEIEDLGCPIYKIFRHPIVLNLY